jgi:hypothetical protein
MITNDKLTRTSKEVIVTHSKIQVKYPLKIQKVI